MPVEPLLNVCLFTYVFFVVTHPGSSVLMVSLTTSNPCSILISQDSIVAKALELLRHRAKTLPKANLNVTVRPPLSRWPASSGFCPRAQSKAILELRSCFTQSLTFFTITVTVILTRRGPRRRDAVKRLRRSFTSFRSLRDDCVSSARQVASISFWCAARPIGRDRSPKGYGKPKPSTRAAVKAGEAAREAGRLYGEHGDGSGAVAHDQLRRRSESSFTPSAVGINV